MPNEPKGWDDDEETIINFSPKPRPQPSPVPAEPGASPAEDVLGLRIHPAPAFEPESSSRGIEFAEVPGAAPQEPLPLPAAGGAPAAALPGFAPLPAPNPEPIFGRAAQATPSPASAGKSERPDLDLIDPPTVKDVPEAVRRELEIMHPQAASPAPASDPVADANEGKGQSHPDKALHKEADDLVVPPLPPVREGAGQEESRPGENRPAERKLQGAEDVDKTSIYELQKNTEEVQDVAWVVLMKTPSVRLHQVFRLDGARMEIGRAYDTPIFLDDRTVSMRHAAIRYERVGDLNEFVLYDLASTNGTYLNGVPIHLAVLKDDDRIRVGETEMAFKKVGEPKSETK